MNLWEAVFLGGLQGATEFFPVSSSGHLVVGQTLLGLQIPGVQFEVAVHVATLISVLVIYRDRLIELLSGTLRRNRDALRYVGLLALATLPAAPAVDYEMDHRGFYNARYGASTFKLQPCKM